MHRTYRGSPEKGDTKHTHEIRSEDGEWIWMGGESDMALIFNNLSGRNFEGRPAQAYEDYMAWITESTREAWPGRANPFAPGKQIVLAEINGRQLDEHRYCSTKLEEQSAGRAGG